MHRQTARSEPDSSDPSATTATATACTTPAAAATDPAPAGAGAAGPAASDCEGSVAVHGGGQPAVPVQCHVQLRRVPLGHNRLRIQLRPQVTTGDLITATLDFNLTCFGRRRHSYVKLRDGTDALTIRVCRNIVNSPMNRL